MASEGHVRACIFGLSGTFFSLYDEAVAAHSTKQLRDGQPPPRERDSLPMQENVMPFGCSVRPFTRTGESHNCSALLFLPHKAPPRRHSAATLVDWCSHFVPPAPARQLSERDALRWFACVEGSMCASRETEPTLPAKRAELRPVSEHARGAHLSSLASLRYWTPAVYIRRWRGRSPAAARVVHAWCAQLAERVPWQLNASLNAHAASLCVQYAFGRGQEHATWDTWDHLPNAV